MTDNAFGEFFFNDGDDDVVLEEELVSVPIVIPDEPAARQAPAPSITPPATAPVGVGAVPAVRPEMPVAPTVQAPTREQRLAAALDELMENNPEVLAAALVSLDGFTMASALPESMEDDRVGAMSAAILGLGERAAAELGRGALTQVFIEGETGYVMLIAAGDRAVLTCIAAPEAKLGLVLYDMRDAARSMADILG